MPLDRGFSASETQRLRKGLVPIDMDDRWFIYWEDDRLFFHRSWSGFCVYVVRFTPTGDGSRMIEAHVNRDPEQYTETRDAHDAKMISYLIDILLLQNEAAFPS